MPQHTVPGKDWQHKNCLLPAAVLLLMRFGLTEMEIVLTRRSMELPTHAGQISLPGGTPKLCDQGPEETAIREAREEIGLDCTHVDVLGALEPVHLPTGFCVTPVLAVSESPMDFIPCPREVEEIIIVPLSRILDRKIYLSAEREVDGETRPYFYFNVGDHLVWGATAKILRNFALLVEDIGPSLTGK